MKFKLMKFQSLLLLILLTATTSVAFATPKLFRTLGIQTQSGDLFYTLSNKDTPAKIRQSARSTYYEYDTSSISKGENNEDLLVFYRLEKDEEGKTLRIPVAQADISQAGIWPLIIFRPASGDSNKLVATALADDVETFPAPNLKFFNLTGDDVLLQASGATAPLPKGRSLMINPGLKEAGGSGEIKRVMIGVTSKGELKLFYSNNWVIRPSTRTMVLIFVKDEQLQVERIAENVAAYMAAP